MKGNLIKVLSIIGIMTIVTSTAVTTKAMANPSSDKENIKVESAKEKEDINTIVDKEGKSDTEKYVPVEKWMGNQEFSKYILKVTNKDKIENVTYEDLDLIKEIDFDTIGLDCIPEIILEFNNLEKLTLVGDFNIQSNNKVLKELYKCEKLKMLCLIGNGLKTFPEVIFNMPNLETLYLNIRDLTEIPMNIDTLKNLKSLGLQGCRITEIPDNLYNMSNLEYLNLSGNKIGDLSPKVANLKNLKSLGLEHCGLTSLPNIFKDMNDELLCSVSYNYLIDLPKVKSTQKIRYMANFINCPVNYEETGIKVSVKEDMINIDFGKGITRDQVDELVGATHNIKDTNKSLIYVPYEYEVLINEKELISIEEVKNLNPGKYSVRIRFEGAPEYNDFAGTNRFTLNIVGNLNSVDNNNSNLNNENKVENKVQEDKKEESKGGNLPYTGGVASMATILFGCGLVGTGAVLYKKKNKK